MFLLAQHGDGSPVANAAQKAASRAIERKKKQLTERIDFVPVGGFAGVAQANPKAARKIVQSLLPPDPLIQPTYGPCCSIVDDKGQQVKETRGVTVDQKLVYKLIACDQFGSKKDRGGDRIVTNLRGPAPGIPEVTDNNNGTYTITCAAGPASQTFRRGANGRVGRGCEIAGWSNSFAVALTALLPLRLAGSPAASRASTSWSCCCTAIPSRARPSKCRRTARRHTQTTRL